MELLSEELCKHYTQALQDTLLPDLHRNLEDFRSRSDSPSGSEVGCGDMAARCAVADVGCVLCVVPPCAGRSAAWV